VKDIAKIANNLFKNSLILAAFILVLFSGCNLINPDEDVPVYVKIDSIIFETDVVHQGKNTHSITDVWIDLNGNRLGVFELPAIFPVLAEGNNDLYIFAGIKDNGVSNNRKVYKFYTSIKLDTNFIPGQILDITPKFMYKEEAITNTWIETFDFGSSIDTTALSNVNIQTITDPDNASNMLGAIYLDNDNIGFEGITNEAFDVPLGNDEIYLEIDYKNNNAFYIGVVMIIPNDVISEQVACVFDSDEWSKIYIDLTPTIRSQANAYAYFIYIRAVKEETVSEPIIFLDNLKLVHF